MAFGLWVLTISIDQCGGRDHIYIDSEPLNNRTDPIKAYVFPLITRTAPNCRTGAPNNAYGAGSGDSVQPGQCPRINDFPWEMHITLLL